MTPGADVARVLDLIDEGDVTELALALGNIDSPSGGEHAVSDYLFDWCSDAGLLPHRVRALPDLAANIVGRVPGSGSGRSLLFNSHMDTAVAAGDTTYFRHPDAPEFHSAWRDDERITGIGVVNDKGPMACWLVAAAAIRRSGVRLHGDLVLTMVTGEIGHEPVEEFQGTRFSGKDYGSRYVATHGALADYALVAETTNFTPVWVEPGKAFFRIVIYGAERGIYTPYLQRPYDAADHPNAIVRAGLLIPLIEDWARDYQERTTSVRAESDVVPKVNIGAIRAGHPTQPILSPVTCSLYLDVRTVPGENPMSVHRELRGLLTRAGLAGDVDCYLFRRGYEARGCEPLVDALRTCTSEEPVPTPAPQAGHTASSMWRDLNVWNELGVPAVTFGPGTGTGGGNSSIAVADLMRCARVYARTALAVCDGVVATDVGDSESLTQ